MSIDLDSINALLREGVVPADEVADEVTDEVVIVEAVEGPLRASITAFVLDELKGSGEDMDKLSESLQDFLTADVTDERAVAELLLFAKSALPKLEASLDPHRGFDAILRWRAMTARVIAGAKALGREADFDSQYLARSVERHIGRLVREGQKNNLVYSQSNTRDPNKLMTGTFFAGVADRTSAYAFDAAPEAEFEQVLAKAREEGNLSRANVMRILRGEDVPANRKFSAKQREDIIRQGAEAHLTSAQIAHKMGVATGYVREQARLLGVEIRADKVMGKGQGIDPVRIIKETVHTLDGVAFGLGLLGDVSPEGLLDPQEITELVASLGQSLRVINRFVKQLRKERES